VGEVSSCWFTLNGYCDFFWMCIDFFGEEGYEHINTRGTLVGSMGLGVKGSQVIPLEDNSQRLVCGLNNSFSALGL